MWRGIEGSVRELVPRGPSVSGISISQVKKTGRGGREKKGHISWKTTTH